MAWNNTKIASSAHEWTPCLQDRAARTRPCFESKAHSRVYQAQICLSFGPAVRNEGSASFALHEQGLFKILSSEGTLQQRACPSADTACLVVYHDFAQDKRQRSDSDSDTGEVLMDTDPEDFGDSTERGDGPVAIRKDERRPQRKVDGGSRGRVRPYSCLLTNLGGCAGLILTCLKSWEGVHSKSLLRELHLNYGAF